MEVPVPDCCSSPGNDDVFGDDVARRTARRYRRRGLKRRERDLVDPLVAVGVDGATVLEIGGGVGQLQLALLDRGAASAVNVELSPHYERSAAQLAVDAGHEGRTTRVLGDAARLDGPLPAADVAVLYRVVCCTDDWRGMLDAALGAGPRLVGLTLPRDGPLVRTVTAVGNAVLALGRGAFRMRHHDPDEVVAHLREAGYAVRSDRSRAFWRTVVLVG